MKVKFTPKLLRRCMEGEFVLVMDEEFIAELIEKKWIACSTFEIGDCATWKIGVLQCRMCSSTQRAIWPTSCVCEDSQECNHCGNMTAGPMNGDRG